MRKPWIGAALGIGMGLFDAVLLEVLGIQMFLGELVVTWPVMGVYALTFGALGYMIGRQLELRAELEAQQTQLVESEKLASLGRMAAGVAHEVRNPLGVIRSSAEVLGEEVESPDGLQASRFIVEEVDRLDAFVGDILDFSRPVRRVGGSASVEDLVSRAVALGGSHLQGVEVSVTSTRQLPELFDRVVLGLLVNAAQAGAHRVEVRDEPGGLVFEDDGPGVPDEVREQIFEPFFTTKARGTGLGLAMARRLVEAHGGSLSLEPAAASGHAVFRIELE